ncbi:tyrosine-type recombinase/integrase [candidate division KSB1 bacterium]|nr:tyrosine-type recombinase/integrase [candidate division KSB1 bacterium]
MKKIRNPNHPKKGSHTRMEPIRSQKDIKAIMKLLSDSPRNRLLFVMGINNGLRVGDLLKLKVSDVRKMRPGDSITIMEGKTGKQNVLVVNKAVYDALKGYLDMKKPDEKEYLFKSRKGDEAITIQAVNNKIKQWTVAINMRGNYGAHSLRKTWGYIQRTKYGVGFELICRRFNHSSPSITMRYLGIEDKEVQDLLMNEVG